MKNVMIYTDTISQLHNDHFLCTTDILALQHFMKILIKMAKELSINNPI